jgi:hypothetical protein
MSPEQWAGATKQSSKADVFGFGLTLFAVVCKTEVPWFDVKQYGRALQGDATAYDDVKAIGARVAAADWPAWPAGVPDAAVGTRRETGGGVDSATGTASTTTRPPAWLTALMKLLLVSDPNGRLPMAAVRDCLKKEQAPDEYLQKQHFQPTQGAWQPVADAALVDKAVPPFFADSFALPDFLAGLRALPAAPSVEDAVLVMAGNCEGFQPQVACFELEKCQQQWRAPLDAWRREGGREALLQLDPELLLAIRFYTSEGVYRAMNAALRSKARRRVLHFLPFLKLLLQVRAGWSLGARCWRCEVCMCFAVMCDGFPCGWARRRIDTTDNLFRLLWDGDRRCAFPWLAGSRRLRHGGPQPLQAGRVAASRD